MKTYQVNEVWGGDNNDVVNVDADYHDTVEGELRFYLKGETEFNKPQCVARFAAGHWSSVYEVGDEEEDTPLTDEQIKEIKELDSMIKDALGGMKLRMQPFWGMDLGRSETR